MAAAIGIFEKSKGSTTDASAAAKERARQRWPTVPSEPSATSHRMSTSPGVRQTNSDRINATGVSRMAW